MVSRRSATRPQAREHLTPDDRVSHRKQEWEADWEDSTETGAYRLRTVYRTGALREAGVDDCVETLLGVCVARWLSSGKLKGT